jgi:ketosteroid isomerase-like protein
LAGDAEAVGNLVTPDRVAVSGVNGNTVRGRAAQVAADRVFFRDSRVVSFEMRVTAFSAADSLAYAAGVGTHTVINAAGVSRVDRFQYVDILVRGSDGQWRSRYFMNAPPEPAR